MKVKTSKGFTLAELLIVMAVIVVLASVAIPTFTRQLETSRETADVETFRNLYSEAYGLAMDDVRDDGTLNASIAPGTDEPNTLGAFTAEEDNGTLKLTVNNVKLVQAVAGFDYVKGSIAAYPLDDGEDGALSTYTGGAKNITFTFAVAETDAPEGSVTTYYKDELYLSAITIDPVGDG